MAAVKRAYVNAEKHTPVLSILTLLVLFYPGIAASSGFENLESMSIEHLFPQDDNRQIKTTNFEMQFLPKQTRVQDLKINWGLLATYARGDIIQNDIKLKTSASGFGPGITSTYQLWQSNEVSISVNASGYLLVYNKRFPPGGDYYNFMWRAGPAFKYNISSETALEVGFHWAHISNGQGLGDRNPAYDARGVIVRLVGHHD